MVRLVLCPMSYFFKNCNGTPKMFLRNENNNILMGGIKRFDSTSNFNFKYIYKITVVEKLYTHLTNPLKHLTQKIFSIIVRKKLGRTILQALKGNCKVLVYYINTSFITYKNVTFCLREKGECSYSF
jgi:hypothetical protein